MHSFYGFYFTEITGVVLCDFKTRLACAGDYATEHIFMSAEVALFCYRLESLSEAKLNHFVRHFHRLRKYFLTSTKTISQSAELMEVRELLSVLDDCSINWKCIISGYVSCALEQHRYQYNQIQDSYCVAVPFRFVQRLVAEREVPLSKGMALLAASWLPDILTAVFWQWLKYGITLARMRQPQVVDGDDRFKLLFRECAVSTLTCNFMLCYLLLLKLGVVANENKQLTNQFGKF